ncbi:MAG TPA: IS701 family transposase, partial [Rhodothermales bacterium]|nr:IS701 family transposase [Rhodothermales bacterium]
AYLRLEVHRLREAVSFYESKLSIIREAVRRYLADPAYILNPTA